MQAGRIRSTSTHKWGLPFLVLLAILCTMTIIDSMPERDVAFYGYDYYTISGLRSTSETFSRSGTYILHDYSAQVPGCEGCRTIEIQVDYSAPEGHTPTELTNRILPGNSMFADHSTESSAVILMQPFVLAGQDPSPDIPPPKISRFV